MFENSGLYTLGIFASVQKQLIVIGGPTASGKTSLAIGLANSLKTEIISADSRQVYKELRIGVARPNEKELAAAKHHFIASHSIHHPLNAGTYEHEALILANDLFKEHDHLILCGGSGLFIKALCEGFDKLPTDSKILQSIQEQFELNGMEWLQKIVAGKDPEFYATVDQKNPRRLIRALEIMEVSGEKVSELRNSEKQARPFTITYYGIAYERADLYERINRRVDIMMNDGLIEEAEGLFSYQSLAALNTVGYKEIFDYMNKKYSLDEAIEKIKQNSRKYAKRQITWFNNETNTNWLSPENEKALPLILKALI